MSGKIEEIYADGLRQINLSGGMVRYEFVTLQPGEDGAEPFAEEQLKVIMPLQGFLTAYDSMQELIGKLIDAGVLKENKPAQPVKRTAKKTKTAKTAPAAKPRAKKK